MASDLIVVSTDSERRIPGLRPYVFAGDVKASAQGSQVAVRTSWGDAGFLLPLPGEFNVENALLTLALLLGQGVPLDQACAVLELVEAPPGRMQRVATESAGPSVYVDYAHTPDALKVALRSLQNHCSGKLWCVFGCGGDRDRGKRPQMGKVAEAHADISVVTSDNPRTESPHDIIADIVAGMDSPFDVTIIEDRAAAIAWAVRNADVGDIVLIAGKGHENYQLVGTERRDFSDLGTAAASLDRRVEARQ